MAIITTGIDDSIITITLFHEEPTQTRNELYCRPSKQLGGCYMPLLQPFLIYIQHYRCVSLFLTATEGGIACCYIVVVSSVIIS